jgi:hypothetical protein
MRLCADWDDAFAFMARQSNRLDPDERLRLARWCVLHGLRKKALEEASAALRMQPGHLEARQLCERLQRMLLVEKTEAPASARFPTTAARLPALDISSDAVALFATRVQPILMNTCVSCHNGARAGRFQLHRTYDGGQRAATLKNLAAVLPLINAENPEISPLLIKSISPHSPSASAQTPLKRESVPFYTLQTWVLQTLASNPQLRAQRASAGATPAITQAAYSTMERIEARPDPKTPPNHTATSEQGSPSENKARPALTAPGVEKCGSDSYQKHERIHFSLTNTPAATSGVGSGAASSVPESPTEFADRTDAPAAPLDPFDPVIFNRQTRPPQ